MPAPAAHNVVNALFAAAAAAKASDLHLVVGRPPTLRIDGLLVPVKGGLPLTEKQVKELVYSILTSNQIARFEENFDLDAAYTAGGARFRINVHREKNAVGFAARLVPVKIPTVADLSLPQAVADLTTLPHGLILLTGPTGCGKSTTLATLLNLINDRTAANIITLEDPIEFLFPQGKSLIRQRQLGEDMRTFAAGLKHLLRQDPDIVMVGEMRALETIATTLTLAETGHLVFATLHTYSAATTVERIVDAFPPHQQNQIRVQLASVRRAVVTQQLLPKLGGGRIAVREVMFNISAISNLIREGKSAQVDTVLQTSGKYNMYTLAQDAKRLVAEGLIDAKAAQTLVIRPRERVV